MRPADWKSTVANDSGTKTSAGQDRTRLGILQAQKTMKLTLLHVFSITKCIPFHIIQFSKSKFTPRRENWAQMHRIVLDYPLLSTVFHDGAGSAEGDIAIALFVGSEMNRMTALCIEGSGVRQLQFLSSWQHCATPFIILMTHDLEPT